MTDAKYMGQQFFNVLFTVTHSNVNHAGQKYIVSYT